MWTFTCVCTAMVDNSAATCKAFVADLTRVGTFSWFCMFHPCVRLKFGFGFKRSWALSAQEGLRIPHVSRVVVYLQKREDKKAVFKRWQREVSYRFVKTTTDHLA
jgi:hypothetical protein